MDLNALSLDDLKALEKHIAALVMAAARFPGAEPEFWITCDSSGMRLPPMLTAGVGAPVEEWVPPVLIDVDDGPADRVVFARRAEPPAPAADAPGLVCGPLTEAERAQIVAMVKDGVPRPEIAARLRRKVQTVSLWITRHMQADGAVALPDLPAPDAVAAPADAPFPPRAVAAPVAALAQGAPVAPAAVSVEGLTPRLREIEQALPRPVDAELDLDLAEALFRGEKLAAFALDTGEDAKVLAERFRLLAAPLIPEGKKALAPDVQADLLAILRHRVRLARGVAA